MGNQQSSQDSIYSAARSGNIRRLEECWRHFSTLHVSQRKNLLEWKDTDGRTALIIAASRGHTQIVHALIQYGADIYYIAPVAIGGGPLHEATMGKHKNVVQMLLELGLNPFVENQKQQNALGYAIDSYNVGLVRMFERYGIYWGWMLVKIRMLMGSKWKLRWCVVVPRYSFPYDQNGSLESHSLLLIYTDQHAYEPKIKAWLDSASVGLQQNTNDFVRAKLTLQAGHSVPSIAYTQGRPNTGVSLFFKSYDHSEQSKAMVRRFAECVNNNWLNHYPHPYSQQFTPQHSHVFVQEHPNAPPITDVPNTPRIDNIQPLPTEPVIQHAQVQSVDMDSILMNENFSEGASQNTGDEVAVSSSTAILVQADQELANELQQIVEEQQKEEQDEQLCVVCLNEPKTVGFAHGETVHRCIGIECADKFSVGQPCPICKQSIELILKKFYD